MNLKSVKNCNNLRQLRVALASMPLKIDETLTPQIELLHNIIKRLQLKGQPFKVYDAATSDEIEAFWEILLSIDASLNKGDTTKSAIKHKERLQKFLQRCQIKKCGSSDCDLCKPV